MVFNMVNFYVKKILESDGAFTIDDVPILWKERVKKKLEEINNSKVKVKIK